MSQNSSCPSHFYSHQVLIRTVRSEELSGQQELGRLVIISHYRCQLPAHDDPVWAPDNNQPLATLFQNHSICYQGPGLITKEKERYKYLRRRIQLRQARNHFCESQKWASSSACCCCNLVFDKTTFHYCKSLRMFRQHKFCKLNLIFPDRNTLYRSLPTCITASSSSRVTTN